MGGCEDLRRPDRNAHMNQAYIAHPSKSREQQAELGRLIVSTLNLDVDPAAIEPDAPLYGEGLGLDSIDMLEIALAVSQTYGVKLRSDDKDNNHIFTSLKTLSDYIQQHRA